MQAGTDWCLPVQFRFISVGRLIIAVTVLTDILVAASMNACPTLFGMKFTVGHGFIRAVLEFNRDDFCFYALHILVAASMNACPTLFGMKFTVGHGFIRAVSGSFCLLFGCLNAEELAEAFYYIRRAFA